MENLYFYYTYIHTDYTPHTHMLENIYFFISMKKKTKEKNTIHKDTHTRIVDSILHYLRDAKE